MNPFVHFLRFFALADATNIVPVNGLTPDVRHAELPAVPGDSFRWLVPKSDLGKLPAARFEIVLLNAAGNVVGDAVGGIRAQDSERYVEFELTVDALPTGNQQFAVTRSVKNPRYGISGQPERIDVTVLGTVRGTFADTNAYLTAIQNQYELYPHAPTVVTRLNNTLTVRIYYSARFQPSDLDLTSWRIGLGKTPADRYNTNSPSLNVQSLGVVTIPATDRYTVHIGDDIQAGNVYSLQGRTYTALASDTPDTVLSALGLSGNSLLVTAGVVISLSATTGQYRIQNQNRPAIQLLYVNNDGSGHDKYTVVIGSDVLAGNVFQVSAPGMTTRTVVAGLSDTSDTVAAQFNTSSGFLLVPAGQNPVGLTDAGALLANNSNTPTLYLSNKVTVDARNVNRYRVFVGSSVRQNNAFVLGDKTAVAASGDTPLAIAQKLGYTTHPFTVDLPAGQTLNAYAKRGSRYSEPGDVAPVRLSRNPACVRPVQVVAELKLPASVTPGLYSLGLRERGQVVLWAKSNPVRVQAVADETVLVRFGGTDEQRRMFAYHYAELGLTQQVRLPIYVDVPKQKTVESQFTTLGGRVQRTDLRIKFERRLTTTMQPPVFHQALLLALKHPRLFIDGQSFDCLTEYSEGEPMPVSKFYQATTSLTDVSAEQQYLPTDRATNEMAQVVSITGDAADCLLLYLKQNGQYTAVAIARLFSAGEYDVMGQTYGESIRLSVYLNELLILNSLLTPSCLNQAGRIRIGPNDQLRLIATIDSASVSDWQNSTLEIPTPTVETDSPELVNRPGDFGPDYSTDFIQ